MQEQPQQQPEQELALHHFATAEPPEQQPSGDLRLGNLQRTGGAGDASKRPRGRPKRGTGRPAAKAAARSVVRHPRQATVTTRSGAQLTLYQYQQFASREQGKLFIRQFALAQGKRVLIDRTASGGSNIVFVCKSATACTFKVRILRSKRKGENAFYVTTLETDHGAQCTGKVAVTRKQVLRDIREASEANTTLLLTGADAQSIVERIQAHAAASQGLSHSLTTSSGSGSGGVAANPRGFPQASVVVRTAAEDAMSDAQKLQALLAQFQAQNPTSSMQVDAYSERALRRAFLKLPYAAQIQQQSARVLGFEATALRSSSSNSGGGGGVTLELVTKDGNDDSVTLAVALCDGCTAENYAWFFNCCLSSGLSLDVPIVCDRSLAMLTAIASLPMPCMLLQSTKHLLANMARELAPRDALAPDVRALVLQAQAATTAAEYESVLALIDAQSAAAGDYLRRVDPDTWAKHTYLHRYPLYGAQCAALRVAAASPEAVAVADAASDAAAAQSPLLLFQSYIERAMERVYQRRRNVQQWLRSGQLLTQFGERVLLAVREGVPFCRVAPNDDETGRAYVWDTRSAVPKRRRVNVSANSCTCAYSEQCGLPCKHLAAAVDFFNAGGALWDLGKLCSSMYHARTYIGVYGQLAPVTMPLEEELQWQTTVQVVPVGPTNRCSLCHAFGHNKRRCPNAAGQSA
ncbi:hypothetical protein PybrP1_001294 [[Pythium] brassicae (nom. inval.)]|nr:hypothetical protein PybrP1_001294 [[Pythium] brassicae (nom. inval.)]